MVGRRAVVIALALGLAACSEGGEPSAGSTSSTASTAPTPTFTGDGSTFCDAMLGVGQVGGARGAPAAEVLAANDELVALLDEAQASAPADAPADFEALLDDYRAAAQAIFDAEGDIDELSPR